jgi:hypothetical protein
MVISLYAASAKTGVAYPHPAELGIEPLCAQTDPDLFTPEHAAEARAAKAICRRCPLIGLPAVRAGERRIGCLGRGALAERQGEDRRPIPPTLRRRAPAAA